eukprot:TRINITY_DN10533_c0_g1_i17.p1 TRINITY_DN10533_c0_g1~~TRINITY_DN10533_c0_g1_i17.p1  ORF type:complete len:182 (+),score=32.44 TRINITY_DN10533_c0_g1_i17:170-715(+)
MNSCLKYLLAIIAGSFTGILCTLIISSCIIEVCINHNFAFYFGFLFFAVGLLLFWRNRIEGKSENATVIQRPSDNFFNHRCLVYFVSLVSMLTAVLCIFFGKDWYIRLGHITKVVFLVLVGVSFSFLVVFLIIDIFNCVMQCCTIRSIIAGRQQTYLTITGALIIGPVSYTHLTLPTICSV